MAQLRRSQRQDDDLTVGRRKAEPEGHDQTFADQAAEGLSGDHLANPRAIPNFSAMCPCGHSSLQHGVGVGGSNTAGHCELKGCACSGFGERPGQGMGWAYRDADDGRLNNP